MPCPFGFKAPPEAAAADGSDVGDRPDKGKAGKKGSGACPMGKQADDDRFDYARDPVSWFYQNQIKSEEEFQARKAELRAHAREQLDHIFEAKNKRLVVDSDDEDFSICSSELSAWDSEVHSIQTLASAANSWAASSNFSAPALLALRALLIALALAGAWSGWQGLQAVLQVNRFWGILTTGWVPMASLAAGLGAAALAGTFWWLTEARARPGLLAGQVALQLLCGLATMLALLCWVSPARIDSQLKSSACKALGGSSGPDSRLCQYLPLVQEQINLATQAMMWGNALVAALSLGAAAAGTWHCWELSHVLLKATKHYRRRRHRSHGGVPWEKIKIESLGPVSFCGGGPPRPAAGAKGGASAEGKKTV